MKLKTLLCFVLVSFVSITFAQDQSFKTSIPDFKIIETSIQDKNSAFYYPALMKRYRDNDTTLTTEEYRYLYYGFSFQDNYSAYGKSKHNEDISKLFDKKELAEDDRSKIIVLENKILEEFPFNLRNLNALINTLDQKGDTLAAIFQIKKLVGIANAILSTGDGKSQTTAMYVISVEHEYDMVGLLGYKTGGQQTLLHTKLGSMDKLELQENDDGIKSMYFNVDRLFASMEKMFKKN